MTHWEPIARELTIGGRVLRVAASVSFVGTIAAGVPIMASGYQSADSGTDWVVTQLRVG